MRWLLVLGCVLIGLAALILGRASFGAFNVQPASLVSSPAPYTNTAKPDFEKEVKPIFQSQCMPCHFQGGKVYDQMPFDKPETIKRLGTKLFTRIKDEKQRAIIKAFLEP